jgi:hypothetical protein
MGSLYGTYKSTNGYRENNDYRAKDVGGKILFDATDYLTLRLSGSFHSDDYGMPGPLPKAALSNDRRSSLDPLDKAETQDGYISLGFDVAVGGYGSLVTDISLRDRDFKSDFPDPLFPFVIDSNIRTKALSTRYVLSESLFGHSNTLDCRGGSLPVRPRPQDLFRLLFFHGGIVRHCGYRKGFSRLLHQQRPLSP